MTGSGLLCTSPHRRKAVRWPEIQLVVPGCTRRGDGGETEFLHRISIPVPAVYYSFKNMNWKRVHHFEEQNGTIPLASWSCITPCITCLVDDEASASSDSSDSSYRLSVALIVGPCVSYCVVRPPGPGIPMAVAVAVAHNSNHC
jgi:hypothetical protein